MISGKPIPYRPDNEICQLAELSIRGSRFEVVLRGSDSDRVLCHCEIWEHTIYEIENLSASLRAAAEVPFPAPFPVVMPNSRISDIASLYLAVDIELCYDLSSPGKARARVFLSSRDSGSGPRKLGVSIGIAASGRYGEVVVEPSLARDLADWLEAHIAELYSGD